MNGAAARATGEGDLLVIFNADDMAVDLPLPAPPDGARGRCSSTRAAARPARNRRGHARPGVAQSSRCTVLLESQSAVIAA